MSFVQHGGVGYLKKFADELGLTVFGYIPQDETIRTTIWSVSL
jgi:hypothetical protein